AGRLGLLTFSRAAVEIETTQVLLFQPIAQVDEQERREVLVAFHEHRQSAAQVRRHIGQRAGIRSFHRLLDRELLGEIRFGNEDGHGKSQKSMIQKTKDPKYQAQLLPIWFLGPSVLRSFVKLPRRSSATHSRGLP